MKKVKLFLTIGLLAGISALGYTALSDTDECHGKCVGSKYCSACKNCSRCAHCSNGGTCGVCR